MEASIGSLEYLYSRRCRSLPPMLRHSPLPMLDEGRTLILLYSIKGCFGESRLIISDPSATKYILSSGLFIFGPAHTKTANALFGRGNIFTARGHEHRHLRNSMNPGFSSNNVRALLPVIRETARKLVDRWESLGFPGNTVDVSGTLNDAALDVIGDAVLEHRFNALAGHSELGRIQRAMVDALSSPTKLGLLLDAALPYIPDLIFRLVWHLPIPTLQMFHQYKKFTDELGVQLAAQDDEGLAEFLPGLVTARVPDRDIGVHLRTILIAGQDTTGGTMGWILYELAQMPEFQQQLREEILLSELESQADYDKMPLLNAIINEVLRMYSMFPLSERVVAEDCLLPLSQPITTTVGTQMSQIPIKKGQCLYVAISAYRCGRFGDLMQASSDHPGGSNRSHAKAKLSDRMRPCSLSTGAPGSVSAGVWRSSSSKSSSQKSSAISS
ncbi:cytochrome P450 [Mycena galericulata]|nr:cytochrome P450 [Mycena galericulata]